MVLLKNQSDWLPLDKAKIKSVAVIGPDAYPAVPVGGGSAQASPFVAVSYLEGLVDQLAGFVTYRRQDELIDLVHTEIDDAFSVTRVSEDELRIGIHIAAPALAGRGPPPVWVVTNDASASDGRASSR